MIQKLKYSEIDFDKYDKCLQGAEQYKYSAEKSFLDITSQKRWDLLVYKDYEAVMPLPYIERMGFKFIVNPKLCQQLGIFSKFDTVYVNDLFLEFFEKKFRIWYYAFNDKNIFSKSLTSKKNFLINSDQYDNVQQKYSPKRKRKLRLDEETLKNSHISENINFQDAKDFIYKHMLGAGKEKNRIEFLRIFKDLYDRESLMFYGFIYHSKITNLIALYISSKSITLLGTFNDKKFLKLSGASVLIDCAIKNYIENRVFDFEGSEIPSVEEFFRGFRPELRPYKVIQNSKRNLFKKIIF